MTTQPLSPAQALWQHFGAVLPRPSLMPDVNNVELAKLRQMARTAARPLRVSGSNWQKMTAQSDAYMALGLSEL